MIYYLVNLEALTVWARFTNERQAIDAKNAANAIFKKDDYKFEIVKEKVCNESYVKALENAALKMLLKEGTE